MFVMFKKNMDCDLKLFTFLYFFVFNDDNFDQLKTVENNIESAKSEDNFPGSRKGVSNTLKRFLLRED